MAQLDKLKAAKTHSVRGTWFCLARVPNSARFFAGGSDFKVYEIDLAAAKPVTTLEAPGMYTWDPVQRRHSIGGVRSLAFSPDGKLLAVGGIGKIGNIDHLEGKPRVEVFDWQKGTRVHEYLGEGIKGLVERLVFHPKGEWLLAAGGANNGFLMFFDLKGPKALRQETVPMHVHGAALNEAAETGYA